MEDAADEAADAAESVADDVAETVQSGLEGASEVSTVVHTSASNRSAVPGQCMSFCAHVTFEACKTGFALLSVHLERQHTSSRLAWLVSRCRLS